MQKNRRKNLSALNLRRKKDFNHDFGNMHWQNLKPSREYSFILLVVIFHFNNMSVGLFGRVRKKNGFSSLMNICSTFYSLSKILFTFIHLSS